MEAHTELPVRSVAAGEHIPQGEKKSASPSANGDAPQAQEPQSDTIVAQPSEDCKPNYWAIIPADVRYDPQLTPNAKLLYGELSALTRAEGYCWASNAYFAWLYGLTEDRISRLMALLERQGYITRETIRDEKSKVVTGRKIWLYKRAAVSQEPPGKNTGTSRQKYRDPPGKNTKGNSINNNTIPPIVPQRGTTKAGARFEHFWRLFPDRNGRKNGKSQARAQWERLGVEGNQALYEQILLGLDAYKRSSDVARGYAMDAVRWLRNRRWEDEQVAQATRPAPAEDCEPLEELLGGLWDG